MFENSTLILHQCEYAILDVGTERKINSLGRNHIKETNYEAEIWKKKEI